MNATRHIWRKRVVVLVFFYYYFSFIYRVPIYTRGQRQFSRPRRRSFALHNGRGDATRRTIWFRFSYPSKCAVLRKALPVQSRASVSILQRFLLVRYVLVTKINSFSDLSRVPAFRCAARVTRTTYYSKSAFLYAVSNVRARLSRTKYA